MFKKARLILGGVLLFSAHCLPAYAQTYPEKPISIVVPFAPGGPTDTSARVVANALAKKTGKSFIVENYPGAGSIIGSAHVATAEPDGYTLLWGTASGLAIAPHINHFVRYDPNKSFAPVAQVAAAPFILAVRPDLKIQSVQKLIELGKKRPGKLNYGSTGIGGSAHMVAALFGATTGITATHIPYKGGAQMVQGMLSGDVDYLFDTPTTIVPMAKEQKLVPLAVTSRKRWPGLPEVKTMEELGVANFEATTWFGMLAPAGTPKDRIDWLNKNVLEVLKEPAVERALANSGFFVEPSSPEQFKKKIADENIKWAQLIKSANIKVQ